MLIECAAKVGGWDEKVLIASRGKFFRIDGPGLTVDDLDTLKGVLT